MSLDLTGRQIIHVYEMVDGSVYFAGSSEAKGSKIIIRDWTGFCDKDTLVGLVGMPRKLRGGPYTDFRDLFAEFYITSKIQGKIADQNEINLGDVVRKYWVTAKISPEQIDVYRLRHQLD